VRGTSELLPQSPEGNPIPSILSRRMRTLSFWAKELADPACRARWERLARGAESAMGDTRVELLAASAPTAAGVARSACPDVMLVHAGELDGLVNAGLLLPLGPNDPMSWFNPDDDFRVARNAAVPAEGPRAGTAPRRSTAVPEVPRHCRSPLRRLMAPLRCPQG